MDSISGKDAPKPVDRRHLLTGGAALAGAALAKLIGSEPADASHNTNIAYDSQTVMHTDVTNTAAGSTRVSSNISGTAAFVALNNYPVGISRPDGMLGRTMYTTSNCAGVAGTCEAASGGNGVMGAAKAANGTGVYGYAGSVVPSESSGGGVGVFGRGTNAGVLGRANNGSGAQGEATTGTGVLGKATEGVGVEGTTETGAGVVGRATGAGVAARFVGRTVVQGNLEVTGGLTATTVASKDGGSQQLFAPASPDPWVEDIGEVKIRRGRAAVRLRKEFDDLVRSRDYQIFLTEYGNLGGVYIAKRSAHGFVVKARRGRRARGRVGYRVVAKRADAAAARAASAAR
jgi:hypothetical protein